MGPTDVDRPTVIDRLATATNEHDVDAITACFAEEYVNETPSHPERGFTGRDQVRRNWVEILAAVPDVSCVVTRRVWQGNDVWTEWEHRGTRRDGAAHLMRGVIIFSVEGDEIRAATFYLEPVDPERVGIDDAVRRQVGVTPGDTP